MPGEGGKEKLCRKTVQVEQTACEQAEQVTGVDLEQSMQDFRLSDTDVLPVAAGVTGLGRENPGGRDAKILESSDPSSHKKKEHCCPRLAGQRQKGRFMFRPPFLLTYRFVAYPK